MTDLTSVAQGGSVRTSLSVEIIAADRTGKALQRSAKRLLDMIGASVGLVLFAPVFALIALAIKATSAGPVLFRQRRVGQDGRDFGFLKFRSMTIAQDQGEHEQLIAQLTAAGEKLEGAEAEAAYQRHVDARVTRVGRFLRTTSLDELPQLINVLKGDMSLVGPRPHPVYEVERYAHWQRPRLKAKPGITGLSKVMLRCSPQNYDLALEYDVVYVRNWSLALDLLILFRTLPVILFRRDAY